MPSQPGAQAVAKSGYEPQPFDFGSFSPATEAAPVAYDTTVKARMPGPAGQKTGFDPQPFDFSALSAVESVPPPAPPPQHARPAAAPSAFEPQPFDFSSLSAPPETLHSIEATRPPPPPSHSAFDPPSFDFGSIGAEPPPPPMRAPPSAPRAAPPPTKPARPVTMPPARMAPPPPPPPAPPPPAKSESELDLGMPMDFGPPDAPMPEVTQKRPMPAAPTQTDLRAQEDPLADVPFSDDHLSLDPGAGLEAEPGARGALFDMSAADVADAPANQLSVPADNVAVAKIALKKVTAESLAQEPSPAALTDSKVNRKPRGLVAMFRNVVSAAMLLIIVGAVAAVVLNDGKIDPAQSWAKVKSAFSTPRELVAFDITNGLYDTRAGRPVFYVRGEIKNRGKHAGRVKVKAEIFDGEDLVRAAEGLAGATPTPEDLYAISNADDLEHLATRLAPSAKQIEPGAQADFLVAFYEYPPDLKDFRVRVTVTPDDGKTAAR